MRHIFRKLIITLYLLYCFQCLQRSTLTLAAKRHQCCCKCCKKKEPEIIIEEGFLNKLYKFYESCTDDKDPCSAPGEEVDEECLYEDEYDDEEDCRLEEEEPENEEICLPPNELCVDEPEMPCVETAEDTHGIMDVLAEKTVALCDFCKCFTKCIANRRCCVHSVKNTDAQLGEDMRKVKEQKVKAKVAQLKARDLQEKLRASRREREYNKKKHKRDFHNKIKLKEKIRRNKQKERTKNQISYST